MNVVLYSIICFFALYGILELILNIIRRKPCANTKKVISQPYAVLNIKNQEDCVESIVRSVAWQMTAQEGCAHYINELIIIDLGSSDQTPDILKLLSHEYDFIRVMNKDEYIRYISLQC